jgi:hypothetical protein
MKPSSRQRWTQAKYAFVGLMGGNVALLLILLADAFVLRSKLITLHMGRPGQQIALALQIFLIYGFFSFVGWLLVALPIALFVPAETIVHLGFLWRLAIGVTTGPVALLLVFVVASRGRLDLHGTFTNTGWLRVLSIVMSSVAFCLYVALLRKARSIAGSSAHSVRERSMG